jgi:hypothetical protein
LIQRDKRGFGSGYFEGVEVIEAIAFVEAALKKSETEDDDAINR